MRPIQLTKEEKAIEAALLKGEYVPVRASEHAAVVRAISAKKKDSGSSEQEEMNR